MTTTSLQFALNRGERQLWAGVPRQGVTLQERPDGMGTITFGPVPPFAAMYGGMTWPGMPEVPAFEMIPDARRIYAVIREAQQGATTR